MGEALLKPAALLLVGLLAGTGARAQEAATPALEEAALPAPPAEPAEEGPTVRAIEIRSDAALPEKERGELGSLLAVEVGKPLTDERTRRTLRNVQASGAASEVELYTRPADGEEGVIVAVVLRPLVRVERVLLEGELGLSESELRRAVPQRTGDPLVEDRVVRGVYELQDLYRERGYLRAQVRVRVALEEQIRRADVIYQIASGPRARVGTVEFRGETAPFTPAKLIERLAAKPGEPYGRGRVRDDAERLQTWLIEQGHRTARVDPPEERADPEAGVVHLVYPIVVGPQVMLRVVGADAKRLRKQELLPFMEEQGYDEALVIQAAARIKEHYQRQGHYKVQVDWREERKEDVLEVVLTIVPGPVYTLQEVEFTGNASFDDKELEDLMTVGERSLLSLGSGRLIEEELEADLENVRRFYALQGFAEVEVGPPVVVERGSELRLEIPVEEGVRRRVGALDFRNVQALDVGDLRKRLPLKEQGPFHPLLLEQTLAVVRAAYADAGYAEAQVSARANWNPDETVVDLVVEAIEGPQTVVDRVIVRGNRKTESEVIRRTLGVERGEPISENRLLELERDLYQLGIFSSVDVQLTRAGLGGARRDLVVRVEEGKSRRVTYGVGYEYNGEDNEQSGPRGGVSFSHNNLFGKAVSLRTDLRLSEFDQSARLIVDQPHVGRYPVPLTSSVFFFHETKDHWEVERYGTRFEAVKSYGDRRVGLAIDYRIVDTTLDPGFGLIDVDERHDRPYELSSLVPSFLWDRRDDPVLATRGWSTLAQLQYAFPAFGTDGDFLKLFVQQTQYLSLGRAGVLVASARAGGVEPFAELPGDDPELPEELPSSDIFIDERFFAGGQTTHRAYEKDDLGIRGESLIQRPSGEGFAEVGGNGLFLFNLEYRFPIAGAFGGTVFYDAGNVWADWRSIDWGEVKEGIGVGVRYLSPIGPLRLDAGWRLDPDPDEDRGPVILISFGNPF